MKARAMLRLLHEYHATGEIHVANIHQVDCASRLDGVLVEMKDALVEIFHPAPGADGEEMEKNLDLGEEPEKPARKIRLGSNSDPTRWVDDEDSFGLSELDLDEFSVKETRPIVPRSGVEEKIRESIRRGEDEQGRLKNLKAHADSLVDPDVNGVVPRDVVEAIQSSAYTIFNCLKSLQEETIPSTLLQIKRTRNHPVHMPQ